MDEKKYKIIPEKEQTPEQKALVKAMSEEIIPTKDMKKFVKKLTKVIIEFDPLFEKYGSWVQKHGTELHKAEFLTALQEKQIAMTAFIKCLGATRKQRAELVEYSNKLLKDHYEK